MKQRMCFINMIKAQPKRFELNLGQNVHHKYLAVDSEKYIIYQQDFPCFMFITSNTHFKLRINPAGQINLHKDIVIQHALRQEYFFRISLLFYGFIS